MYLKLSRMKHIRCSLSSPIMHLLLFKMRPVVLNILSTGTDEEDIPKYRFTYCDRIGYNVLHVFAKAAKYQLQYQILLLSMTSNSLFRIISTYIPRAITSISSSTHLIYHLFFKPSYFRSRTISSTLIFSS